MADSLHVYRNLLNLMASGGIDLVNDAFKLMLVDSSYTPSASHVCKADLTGEVSGDNYSSGGIGVNKRFILNGNVGNIYADDVTFNDLTVNGIRYGVIYDDTPEDESQKHLIAYIDFNNSFDVMNATLNIVWHSDGILKIEIGQ